MNSIFISKTKIFLYWLPLITVAIITLILFLLDNYLYLLVGIFGGLYSLSFVSIAIQMTKNLSLLQKYNLVEKMQEETPQERTPNFAVTENFVWGFKRKLCIPLCSIESIRLHRKEYINSATKNNCGLEVTTICGKKFDLLYFNGLIKEKHINTVKLCAVEMLEKNPQIKIKGVQK